MKRVGDNIVFKLGDFGLVVREHVVRKFRGSDGLVDMKEEDVEISHPTVSIIGGTPPYQVSKNII